MGAALLTKTGEWNHNTHTPHIGLLSDSVVKAPAGNSVHNAGVTGWGRLVPACYAPTFSSRTRARV